MSKIMELADKYVCETHPRITAARAALAAEVEKLEAEIVRLQHEVVNRNQRALDGDQAKAAFNGMYDKAEALREKLAAVEKDAARMEWIEHTLFVRTWNGVIDSGSNTRWRVAEGDYRRLAASMNGDTFRAAIDAAMEATK